MTCDPVTAAHTLIDLLLVCIKPVQLNANGNLFCHSPVNYHNNGFIAGLGINTRQLLVKKIFWSW